MSFPAFGFGFAPAPIFPGGAPTGGHFVQLPAGVVPAGGIPIGPPVRHAPQIFNWAQPSLQQAHVQFVQPALPVQAPPQRATGQLGPVAVCIIITDGRGNVFFGTRRSGKVELPWGDRIHAETHDDASGRILNGRFADAIAMHQMHNIRTFDVRIGWDMVRVYVMRTDVDIPRVYAQINGPAVGAYRNIVCLSVNALFRYIVSGTSRTMTIIREAYRQLLI